MRVPEQPLGGEVRLQTPERVRFRIRPGCGAERAADADGALDRLAAVRERFAERRGRGVRFQVARAARAERGLELAVRLLLVLEEGPRRRVGRGRAAVDAPFFVALALGLERLGFGLGQALGVLDGALELLHAALEEHARVFAELVPGKGGKA